MVFLTHFSGHAKFFGESLVSVRNNLIYFYTYWYTSHGY